MFKQSHLIKVPQEVWVNLKTVEQAAYTAVAHFNDDNISFLKILYHLGISPAILAQ